MSVSLSPCPQSMTWIHSLDAVVTDTGVAGTLGLQARGTWVWASCSKEDRCGCSWCCGPALAGRLARSFDRAGRDVGPHAQTRQTVPPTMWWQCAGCALGMDGNPLHAVTHGDYELHFCSETCAAGFSRTEAVLGRLAPRAALGKRGGARRRGAARRPGDRCVAGLAARPYHAAGTPRPRSRPDGRHRAGSAGHAARCPAACTCPGRPTRGHRLHHASCEAVVGVVRKRQGAKHQECVETVSTRTPPRSRAGAEPFRADQGPATPGQHRPDRETCALHRDRHEACGPPVVRGGSRPDAPPRRRTRPLLRTWSRAAGTGRLRSR